jgi:hypothetical protein
MNSHDSDRPSAEPAQSPVDPVDDRLDSWKEIAAYARRGVRTVQRWERDSGLPIHRLNRDKRSVVFAFRSEIDGWWADQSRDGADEDIPVAPGASGSSEFPELKPGSHRWFIASPPMLWFLAFLLAAGVWIFGTVGRTPRLPDSSAREVALPTNLANPESQS